MMRIRRRLEVLERLMVRNVVRLRISVAADVRSAAHCLAVDNRGRPEAALEEAPRDAFGAEQVADIVAAHRYRFPAGTVVEHGLRIGNDRPLHDIHAELGRQRIGSRHTLSGSGFESAASSMTRRLFAPGMLMRSARQ